MSEIKRASVDVVPSQDDYAAGEVKNIHALDEADIFLSENGYTQQILDERLADQEQNKKLLRKVDWVLMPLLCGTYMLQFVDKQGVYLYLSLTRHGQPPISSWSSSI